MFPKFSLTDTGKRGGQTNVFVKTEGIFSFEKKLACVIFMFIFPPSLFKNY